MKHIWRRGVVSFTCPGCRYSTRTRGQYEVVSGDLPEDQDLFGIEELEPVGGPNISIVELPSQKLLTVMPFMPTRDLFRGLLYATNALFSYTLMLTAMSVHDFYYPSSRVLH